jgi:hypothetical protein
MVWFSSKKFSRIIDNLARSLYSPRRHGVHEERLFIIKVFLFVASCLCVRPDFSSLVLNSREINPDLGGFFQFRGPFFHRLVQFVSEHFPPNTLPDLLERQRRRRYHLQQIENIKNSLVAFIDTDVPGAGPFDGFPDVIRQRRDVRELLFLKGQGPFGFLSTGHRHCSYPAEVRAFLQLASAATASAFSLNARCAS